MSSKRMRQELKRQKEILQLILESMGDGVAVADEKGKFILFNAAAEQILGIGATDEGPSQWPNRYGLYLSDTVTPHPPEQLPLARALRGESVDAAELFVRNPSRPEGIHISVTGRPLKDQDGVLRGGVVVFRDITAQKRAQETLLRAKEEAERATRFKDQFLSTMSHELRTPLNAVLGFSDLLSEERYGSLNERQRRYLKHIHTGGQHLLNLINDILDLSKIEAGRLELAIENVPVKSTFDGVLSALQPLAQKKSQTLSRNAAPGLAVRADATRFKQMLMNLLGNAIKFTPEGGRIELTGCQDNGHVRIDVRDTGPGIPPEEQKRIFDAFYRLRKPGESAEGTGLGLAITQRLVELHGGQLNLESQPGQGSSFYFSLPLAPTLSARPLRKRGAGPRTGEPAKVLVIEDDAAAVHLIRTQLASAGYSVIVCENPENALEMATKIQPQAITLDILMQPIHGWQVLTQLKQEPRTAGIPVIVITIVDEPAMGAILGADEYLVKPVDKATLLATVERCLEKQRAERKAGPVLVVEDDAPTREVITQLLSAQGYSVATSGDGAQARASVAGSLPELVILDLLLPKVNGFELLCGMARQSAYGGPPCARSDQQGLEPEGRRLLAGTCGGGVPKAAALERRPSQGIAACARPSGDGQSMSQRILVVEDNPANRELLCDWLQAEGYEALSATDLKTAFAAVEAQRPHAILLDVQLGAEDGLSLTPWIRKHSKLRFLPVLAVTAHAMATEKERVLQAGCNACISKPIDFGLLHDQLQKWLTIAAGLAAPIQA